MKLSSWCSVSGAVARVTFSELLRDKILYNVVLCGALVSGLGIVASRLTFIRPERIVLDFGVSAVSLSCAMIAIFLGAGMLAREFERRTVHVTLSHPISRPLFVTGKYLGLAGILLLNWFLLSLLSLGLLIFFQGMSTSFSNPALLPAFFLALLQSLVVGAVTVFMSTFTTTSLSVVMTLGLYLVGHNVSELRAVIAQLDPGSFRKVLEILASMPPNLEYLSLGLRVTYGLPIGPILLLQGVGYAFLVILLFLLGAGLLIDRKEV